MTNRPRPDPQLRLDVAHLIARTKARRGLDAVTSASLIAESALGVIAAVNGDPAACEEGFAIGTLFTGPGPSERVG